MVMRLILFIDRMFLVPINTKNHQQKSFLDLCMRHFHRGPTGDAASGSTRPAAVELPVPHLRGTRVTPRLLYPGNAGATADWDEAVGMLTVVLPGAPSACVLGLDAS